MRTHGPGWAGPFSDGMLCTLLLLRAFLICFKMALDACTYRSTLKIDPLGQYSKGRNAGEYQVERGAAFAGTA